MKMAEQTHLNGENVFEQRKSGMNHWQTCLTGFSFEWFSNCSYDENDETEWTIFNRLIHNNLKREETTNMTKQIHDVANV